MLAIALRRDFFGGMAERRVCDGVVGEPGLARTVKERPFALKSCRFERAVVATWDAWRRRGRIPLRGSSADRHAIAKRRDSCVVQQRNLSFYTLLPIEDSMQNFVPYSRLTPRKIRVLQRTFVRFTAKTSEPVRRRFWKMDLLSMRVLKQPEPVKRTSRCVAVTPISSCAAGCRTNQRITREAEINGRALAGDSIV